MLECTGNGYNIRLSCDRCRMRTKRLFRVSGRWREPKGRVFLGTKWICLSCLKEVAHERG